MKWSRNDLWMVTADHDGFVKYWQANMNNVTMFQAHKEAVRSLRWLNAAVCYKAVFIVYYIIIYLLLLLLYISFWNVWYNYVYDKIELAALFYKKKLRTIIYIWCFYSF